MKKSETRSGSALIVVLGLLAVVMFMAVAFSVSMRTERSGTTNLRHSLSAKQTMQSAISLVMESIDRSFGNPTNNTPVAEWDPPYMTSRTTYPYYTNGAVSKVDDRPTNAKVLTQEIVRHLTPAQLALAKNAKVEWVPMKSGVDASATSGGRPSEDKVVGRYAFIALNTTGLLDMNLAGGGALAQRAKDYGTNAANFQIAGSAFSTTSPNVLTLRESNGGFTSYADLWRILGAPDYMDKAPAIRALFLVNGTSNPYEIKPDLFTTFSTSAEELAPDSSMKIPLIVPESVAARKKYATRAAAAFKKMFDENNDNKEFAARAVPKITRAQLATQALIDYMDKDDVPCGGIDTGGDTGTGYLNYPCTEPVPMLTTVMAWFEVSGPGPARNTSDPDWRNWYKEYEVLFTLQAEAQYLNNEIPPNPSSKSYDLKVEFEFSSFDADRQARLKWKTQAEAASGTKEWVVMPETAGFPGSIVSESSGLTAMTATKRRLYAGYPGEKIFTIRAYAKSQNADLTVNYRGFSELDDNNDPEPLLTEVRVSAKIVNSANQVVQQVPSPSLASNGRDDYRVRVDPGLYHPTGSRPGDPYEVGWAMCLDPRFGYNTECLVFFPPNGYTFWINNESAHNAIPSGTDAIMKQIGETLVDAELNGGIDINSSGNTFGNYLINLLFFSETDPNAAKNIADSFSGNLKIYPDSFHSYTAGGDIFLETDDIATSQTILKYRVANTNMVSAGELGNLVIGPWETLSLFSVFKPKGAKTDFNFHRAVDYFSVGEPRFPTTTDIGVADIASIDKEHFPAMHAGRVNLNPPRNVQFEDEAARDAFLGNTDPDVVKFNYDPVVSVLTGARLNDSTTPTQLTRPLALEIAETFYDEADLDDDLMVRKVSDFGGLLNVAGDENPILKVLQANEAALKIECDAHREALIANTISGFTTRGQTYTVILRADAYSPRYGSDSAGDGTTLASTHAIVELWRDPEPCRRPDGKLFPLNTETPTHNWYIRSVRWF